MQFNLIPHPATPPSRPFDVWVGVDHAGAFGATATTNLWFCMAAPMQQFVIRESEAPGRRDELWQSTCFEAFLKGSNGDYREWNFAASGDWAAYDFTGYREGMALAEIESPPYLRTEDNLTWWAVGATFTGPAGVALNLGLSAVLEETNGTKSYWALAHGADKPDFHDAGCFTARLA
ncbi:MAG: DOMON-like domain-containing protein [Sphingomicrobium sp.]